MARLIIHHAGFALHTPPRFSSAEILFRAFQAVTIAAIAVYIGIAVVNTVLGTGQPDPVYTTPMAGR
jgi:hypothetical protein